MNASVIDMQQFRQRSLQRPQSSDADFVRQHIKGELQTTCGISRIAQAQARALRMVASHMTPDKAIKRAIAWAMCATDPNDPSPPQAA